ncbi:uncharacterized protein LOC143886477 isoform X1 [Tasmannia lanceolata]|uniref:uncharacterized protein LOC143886477 isoform X1 n=1 Tax=Tasmannia lanceolata TaxID=3420 RepID=UPI004063DDE1
MLLRSSLVTSVEPPTSAINSNLRMDASSEQKAELVKKVRRLLSKVEDDIYQCQMEALELTEERCELYGIALPEEKRWSSLIEHEDALRNRVTDLLKRVTVLRRVYVHTVRMSPGESDGGVKAELNAGKVRMGVLSERKTELMKKVRCVLSKMGDVVYQFQTEALELTGERCELYGIALPERKRWLSFVKREDALRKKITDLLKSFADLRPLYVHIMGRSGWEISSGLKAELNAGKESARASQCQTEALELTESSELHGIALPEKERCSGLMEWPSHIERSFLGKSAGGVKKGKVNVGIQVDMEVAEKVDLTHARAHAEAGQESARAEAIEESARAERELGSRKKPRFE